MKQVQSIASVALVSGLLLGLTLVDYPAAQGRFPQFKWGNSRSFSTPNTRVRYTLGLLQAAARSLAYFPTMERAIASAYPDQLKSDQVFQDAEVSLLGVGPLRIGMTLEEATDALGLPLVPIGSNLSGECAYYQPETQAQALGLMVVEKRIIRIDVWPGSTLSTISGVSLGASEEEVRQLYPGQIEATPNPYTQGKFLTLTPNDPELSLYRLVFETNAESQVIQYRTGQFPAVTWPDGCA